MNIGVLGCGNMASAVVEAIYKADKSVNFVTYTPSHTRAVSLAARVKGRAVENLGELGRMDILMIGCKPHQFFALAEELVAKNVPVEEVISLMAATSIGDIQAGMGTDKVTRLMPSLPMRHGEGISLLCHSSMVGDPLRQFINAVLGPSSKVVPLVSEELLDRLTSITASGPAYVYFLAEIFADILTEWLGDKVLSRELAVQLFKGSSLAMEREGGDSLQELIRRVTSKKGVTAEAIESFRQDDMEGIFRQGIEQAEKKLDNIRAKRF